MQNKKRREELFLLLCFAAAGVCAVLAFRFAVPLQAQTPQTLPDTKELAAYTQVELNTADADALCTLPGVGPRNAQAILDYRAQHGPFAQVEDAAQVPGITQAMVDSWQGRRMSARVYLKRGTARLLPWSKRKYGDILL